MAKEVKYMTLDAYCKLKDIKQPEQPEQEEVMTEDDYYATLSMRDRVRFYTLQTQCAVLGQAIHPEGAFSAARKALANSVADPTKLVVKNDATFVEQAVASVPTEAVDDFFFRLQRRHREAQAELNTIKFACEKAVQADAIAKATAYNSALADYQARMAALQSEMTLYRRQRSAEISGLKIVVPDSLQSIYELVNGLGRNH